MLVINDRNVFKMEALYDVGEEYHLIVVIILDEFH